MVREAAGWIEVARELDQVRAGVDPGLALSWVRLAREHARRLGPPSDLRDLLVVLGDGVIRSHAAAFALLRDAGAGDAANPRILLDLATWCGLDSPVQAVTVGTRSKSPFVVYVRDRADLVQARISARKILQHWGILAPATLTQILAEHRFPVDAGDSPMGLQRILGLGGTHNWVWAAPHRQSPLTRALRRIATLNRAVPLRQIPAAVARNTSPHRPAMTGRWPLTLAAVRAWAHSSPDWSVERDTITPIVPASRPRERDLAVITAFAGGEAVLVWSRLRDALQEQGMTPLAAEAIIFWSPLIRRTRSGYTLLG